VLRLKEEELRAREAAVADRERAVAERERALGLGPAAAAAAPAAAAAAAAAAGTAAGAALRPLSAVGPMVCKPCRLEPESVRLTWSLSSRRQCYHAGRRSSWWTRRTCRRPALWPTRCDERSTLLQSDGLTDTWRSADVLRHYFVCSMLPRTKH
jgi:hypothetical protein